MLYSREPSREGSYPFRRDLPLSRCTRNGSYAELSIKFLRAYRCHRPAVTVSPASSVVVNEISDK